MSQDRAETNLVLLPIHRPITASADFGWEVQGCTPLVFAPEKRAYTHHRNVLPTGVDCIMAHSGRLVGVIKPGVYWRSHRWTVSYVVNRQHIPYHFAVHQCPTLDNVRVSVQVDFLFHVADSVRFVYGIAPENMEELLRATQAETVRSLVRTMRISQVRDMRGLDGEDMLITLNDKLSPYGIHIDSVTISNVDLPQDVAESLQRTTAFEAQQKLLEKQHIFQMKVRDDEQKLKTLAQERTNERTRCQEEAKKGLEATKREIAEIENDRNKRIAAIKAQQQSEIDQLVMESAVECAKINQEREKLVAGIREEAARKVHEIELESLAETNAVRVEAETKVSELRAKAFALRAEAEKYASAKMAAKRAHEEKMARLQAIIALASNPNAFITGKAQENPMAGLFSAVREAELLGVKAK